MNWLVRSSLDARWLVIILACVFLGIGISDLSNVPLDVFPEFAPPVVEIQTEAPGNRDRASGKSHHRPDRERSEWHSFRDQRSLEVRSRTLIRSIDLCRTNRPADGSSACAGAVDDRFQFPTDGCPSTTYSATPVVIESCTEDWYLVRHKISNGDDDRSSVDNTSTVDVGTRSGQRRHLGATRSRTSSCRIARESSLASPDIKPSDAGHSRCHHAWARRILRHGESATGDSTRVGGSVASRSGERRRLLCQRCGSSRGRRRGGANRFRAANRRCHHQRTPGLLLIVEKQPWANTLDVTTEVERVLHTLEPAMEGIEYDSTIFRPATFIERAIGNVTHSMAIGCALVLLVLISFLFDWRSAIISATAIPLSIVGALMVLRWYGATVNTMVLAGLTIALGEVVDDAIIDVENIVRRLRQNATAERPASAIQVVLSASLEVRSSVVFATLIVILTFLPVFFLKGLAGSFFRPLAQAYILAILASLMVALTVTPALSLIFSSGMERNHHLDGPLVRRLKGLYERWLPTLLRRPRVSLLCMVLAFLPLVGLTTQLGEELMPKFKETDFLMHWVEKPGIGIDAMDRITLRASDELLSVPGVRNFGSHIGRAEVADEVVGPNFTELWISLDEKVDYDQTVARVQQIVDGYPGLYRDLLTYLSERIKEVLSGTSASIVVRVFGPDLDQLRYYAQEVAHEMEQVPGVTTLKVEPQVLVPQISIRLRQEALAHYGMTPGRLMQNVGTLLSGARVGEIYQDQRIQAVVVRGQETLRSDITDLYDLMIDTPSGAQIPLKELAEIQIVPAPNEIKREGASRRIDVSCNASGRDLGSVAREIEDRIREKIRFANGYHPEFLGEYAEARASRQRMITVSLLSLLGIVVVLFLDFRSWRILLLIGISIPLALLGGLGGVYACNRILSLGSIVGFVTVLGVAIRNMIMLVSHYRHLVEVEHEPWNLTTLVGGASERLAPILMTTLTAGLALVPLVFTGNIPGQEIEYPMAFVILGGLVTSTMVNLLLLPVLLYVFLPAATWVRKSA